VQTKFLEDTGNVRENIRQGRQLSLFLVLVLDASRSYWFGLVGTNSFPYSLVSSTNLMTEGGILLSTCRAIPLAFALTQALKIERS
jgi:hypothetical protein